MFFRTSPVLSKKKNTIYKNKDFETVDPLPVGKLILNCWKWLLKHAKIPEWWTSYTDIGKFTLIKAAQSSGDPGSISTIWNVDTSTKTIATNSKHFSDAILNWCFLFVWLRHIYLDVISKKLNLSQIYRYYNYSNKSCIDVLFCETCRWCYCLQLLQVKARLILSAINLLWMKKPVEQTSVI